MPSVATQALKKRDGEREFPIEEKMKSDLKVSKNVHTIQLCEERVHRNQAATTATTKKEKGKRKKEEALREEKKKNGHTVKKEFNNNMKKIFHSDFSKFLFTIL
eukprot:comp20502_c1_seq1/m.26209 comp20502_c1_seq1/g.26209  ORF comp20502_c1_seq1/g.26209 comp20502_c1_seq1/m.26209 type:complete len:104 (+) comp20502_c1_seq1:297-608(+)